MSEVKVNKISPRTNCGTVTVGDSGDSVTVSSGVPVTVSNNLTVSGDLKSAALKAADGGSIISQSGTTITIGASGDTVSLASGASQTGFGRTGTVDWDTTPKTATFTAVSGDGFFANTTDGAFNMNLPAGSAGAIVSVADYAGTWQTNALTLVPNGSDKIGGVNSNVALNTEGQSATFVFVDSTQGWVNVQDSTSNERGNPNLVATGGTITTSGNCKIHTFTGPGTFTVSNASSTAANNIVSYLVLGSGGGGTNSGGGGAGGFRELESPTTPYSSSPLDGYPSAPNRVTVTAQAYPITVGGGGTGQGNPSVFSTITAAGGGQGGPFYGANGSNGGSGGGGGGNDTGGPGLVTCGGSGNTPPTSPPQGQNGGRGFAGPGPTQGGGAGGGGAGATGNNGGPSIGQGGNGGNGVSTSITTSPVAYAGGGGGGATNGSGGSGGSGGGGAGNPGGCTGGAGTTNRGGGGGGGGWSSPNNRFGGGGAGGSGIVVIRYKYQ